MGGNGGLITLDKNGVVTLQYNTEGMYWDTITSAEKIEVLIYK
ncbi:MAG TPA: hypothetical protein VM888_06040 [Chitinophagaceae bacterium]|nr:hypothetical protein [Chitinophagaceae bacterium]